MVPKYDVDAATGAYLVNDATRPKAANTYITTDVTSATNGTGGYYVRYSISTNSTGSATVTYPAQSFSDMRRLLAIEARIRREQERRDNNAPVVLRRFRVLASKTVCKPKAQRRQPLARFQTITR